MNFETSSNRSFLTRFNLTRKSGRLYSVNKTLSISVSDSDQIMDTRGFNVLGFAANPSSNAFKNIGKSYQNGENCTDTTLRLDTAVSLSPVPFPGGTLKGIKRKRGLFDGSFGLSLDSSLNLRLGHSSSSSDSKGSSATACTSVSSAKETDESSSTDLELDFTLHLGYGKTKEPIYNPAINATCTSLPEVDLGLSLSGGTTESSITAFHPCSSLLHATSHGLSESVITTPKSSVTCTSGITQQQQQQQQQQQRSNNTKQCHFTGCTKGARGASGLCIAHGGGRRCQRTGCHKGAEGRTAFCKAHGGGRRCEFLGCTKSAEGRTDYCIAHGGGRRCAHDGCARAARGKSGLCIRHGGGKRCQKEKCTKSAEGLSGLCISHGGGRRCRYPECPRGAQGSTMFCKAHGGGKRCIHDGCDKGAEGSTPYCKGHGGGKRCSYEGGGCPKSVHGGTLYCVAHGGGKRCAVQECTKSARGRTDYCVRHGGGKRCKSEGCGKSAQGSTDFCKAHGGGKRCCWGQSGSIFGQGHDPCNAFARAKTAFCASHGALVQDKRVHGGSASLGAALMQDSRLSKAEETTKRLVVTPSENMNLDVIMLMDDSRFLSSGNVLGSRSGPGPSAVTIPEGRVHGGSLMAVLNGNSATSLNMSRDGYNGNPSKVTETWIPRNWM